MGKRFHKLRSVRLKFFAAIAAVALVFITVISCLNLFFYDYYYMAQKQDSLRDIYSRVCQSYYTSNNEALQETLFRIENSDSVRISILDAAGAMIYDSDAARNGNSPNFFTSWKTAQLVHSALVSADQRKLDIGHVDFVVVQMNDLRENFLCLVGRLGDGYLVERIPFAFMEQNSMFNSIFLLITGAVTLVICLILGAVLASYFTKPLIEMGSIAKSMAHLDFSQKYEGDEIDEIGQLGQSLNLLSDHLRDAD